MKIRWIAKAANNKSATTLTGAAVVGVVATAVLTARAALKAAKQLEGRELTPEEKTQDVWKMYIPAGVSAVATVACIMRANELNRSRCTALLTAYILDPFVTRNQVN